MIQNRGQIANGCPRCGIELPAGARFCPACGAPNPLMQTPPQPAQAYPPSQGYDSGRPAGYGYAAEGRRGLAPILIGLGLVGLVLVVAAGALLAFSTGGGARTAAASATALGTPAATELTSAPSTATTSLTLATAPTRPGSGTFTGAGSMSTSRSQGTATLLTDGRVLLAGGAGPAAPGGLASAELYDPKSGTVSPTGSMTTGRLPMAAPLPNGKVLVVGIAKDRPRPDPWNDTSADLYDPAVGKFVPTGPMVIGRLYGTATALADGRVLVVGGVNDTGVLAEAELYDPKTSTFAKTGSMTVARREHTASRLPDGRVLIVGGSNDSGLLASAEIYDPGTGHFSQAGSLNRARDGHSATELADGRVLIVGGVESNYCGGQCVGIAETEVYDPAADKFNSTGQTWVTRVRPAATLLPDGRVLVVGGGDSSASGASAELYNPATGKFTPTGSMSEVRNGQTATLLPDGRVLIAGGGTAVLELYQP